MQTDASGCAEEMGKQNARAAPITGTRAYVGGRHCPPLAVLAELVQSSSCRDVQWSGTSLDRGILGSSSCPCTHGPHSGSWHSVVPQQVCADPGAPVVLIRWPYPCIRKFTLLLLVRPPCPHPFCSSPISNFPSSSLQKDQCQEGG